MKKLLILSALLCLSLAARAHNDRVVLKDNTIYEGYISNQIFGEKEVTYIITFTAFEKNFEVKDAHRQDIVYVGDQIPAAWKEWAQKNNKLVGKGKEQSLPLSRITFPGEPTRDYYVLIDGTKAMRCYCIASDTRKVSSNEVERLEASPRESTLLTDVNDVVTTMSKSYVGTIVRQIPGKQLQIWDCKSGVISVVDNADVVSVRKEVFNPDYSLWEQAPYLERVTLKNSATAGLDGVITEQSMVKDQDRSLKITTKSGVFPYLTKDILSITKIPNPEYKPKYDIILEPGQTMVNRDSVLAFVNILKIENPNALTIYYLDPQIIPEDPAAPKKNKKNKDVACKDLKIVSVTDPSIVIETNTPDIEDVYVIKATEREALLVPKKNPVKILTYTDSDLIRKAIKVKKEVSINQTTKMAFKVPEEGYYFIYLSGLDKSWIIQYKKPQQ